MYINNDLNNNSLLLRSEKYMFCGGTTGYQVHNVAMTMLSSGSRGKEIPEIPAFALTDRMQRKTRTFLST